MTQRWFVVFIPFLLAMALGLALGVGPETSHAAAGERPGQEAPAAPATGTLTATLTPVGSPTIAPPGGQLAPDSCEPNDDFNAPCALSVNQSLSGLTLAPAGDLDYFSAYLKAGQIAQAATFPAPGAAADTRLFVYDAGGGLIGQNDDRSGVDLGSSVTWRAAADGWYIILVDSAVPLAGGYDLQLSLALPTVTPTPTASPTPPPTSTPWPTMTPWPTATPHTQPDGGEPNNSPETAFEAVLGTSYAMTLGPQGIDDHDFFRVLVKAGGRYRCAAEKPAGVDPTLRVYSGAIGQGELIAENDDVSPADIGSEVRFAAPGDGPLYAVVESRAGYGSYTFLCEGLIYSPPAAGQRGSATPASPATEAPAPTATPIEVTYRQLPAPPPTTTPVPLTTIRVQVIYDLNANGAADPDEGVDKVSVRAVSRNSVVGWALTDERGAASLTILGPVDRVIVPFLSGWNSPVKLGTVNESTLLIPAVPLPVVMPVIIENERPASIP